MRSFDTNVVARAMLDDDIVQSPIARRLLGEGGLVLASVMLETVWVLTARDRWSRDRCAIALTKLMRLPDLQFGDRFAVEWALQQFGAGADFADMLHLALSVGADRFATFDQGIARYAADSPVPVETL